MLENIHDPYDMLVSAHERINYLELQIKNMMIQSQRDQEHIKALHNSISAIQDSQIMLMQSYEHILRK